MGGKIVHGEMQVEWSQGREEDDILFDSLWLFFLFQSFNFSSFSMKRGVMWGELQMMVAGSRICEEDGEGDDEQRGLHEKEK